jgi:hypothetical protein
MTPSEHNKSLLALSALALGDITPQRDEIDEKSLDYLADFVNSESQKQKIVYTAFDGDHQMLCGLMRQRALVEGLVPANPDSVLGYKETVEARKTKEKVLLDDLSVLRGCDELWIFTDEEATPASCTKLAEGVLVELLFFLHRHPSRCVKFLRASDLIESPSNSKPVKWRGTFEEAAHALADDQREEILRLANSGTKVDSRLRSLTYFLFDPLDYKYARFVRANGYKKNIAPIIPYLAVRVEDFGGSDAAGRALLCWAKLLSLASSLVVLPPLEPSRRHSKICELLRRAWLRRTGSNQPTEGDWVDYHVPKAQQEGKWAITLRERRGFEDYKG